MGRSKFRLEPSIRQRSTRVPYDSGVPTFRSGVPGVTVTGVSGVPVIGKLGFLEFLLLLHLVMGALFRWQCGAIRREPVR